ncbi:MAG: DUF2674 domain-containing protein [Rickettsiaceae bacterium]|nr:DUF2674 domain-containing protein [Rickettsiaceae bacterium]
MTNMTKRQPEKKLVSFLDHEMEMEKIQAELNKGWAVTSLYSNGKSFVGILEKKTSEMEEGVVYIPPRKKIKITPS